MNPITNPVLDAIAARRSIRAYQPGRLSRDQLDVLLAAAVQAPSARNAQPWHFTVTQNEAVLKEINDEAVKNIGRADLGCIYHGAPAVIFLSCDPASRWGRLDCGIAVENIALAAQSIGLGSVILGMLEPAFTGPRAAHFNALLRFPPGHAYAVAIAVGVPAASKDPHPVEPDRVAFID